MIEHVGFPRCVCNKPFTLVRSPAEYREWKEKNKGKILADEIALRKAQAEQDEQDRIYKEIEQLEADNKAADEKARQEKEASMAAEIEEMKLKLEVETAERKRLEADKAETDKAAKAAAKKAAKAAA